MTTNEQWLKSLNTEELADWLTDLTNGIVDPYCFNHTGCMGNCTDCCVAWLKEEHKE